VNNSTRDVLISLIILIGFVSIIYLAIHQQDTYVNNGLEECPIELHSKRTIWVKDCRVYLDILKANNEK